MPSPPLAGLQLRLESDAIVASDGDSPAVWADQSGNGFDTTLNVMTYRAGRFLGGLPSLQLNGFSSYGDIGAPAGLELYAAYTILVVIRTSFSQTNTPFLVSKDDSVAPRGYGLGLAEASTPYFEGGGGGLIRDFGVSLADDLAHVVAVTFDGSTYSLYVEGTLIHSVAGPPITANAATHWMLGRRQNSVNTGYFKGDIGAALIYDSGLSGSDLAAASGYLTDKYAGPPPPPPASPFSAQIDPSGELLILKYRTSNGVTPAAIAAVSGTATLTRNGTPITLARWCHFHYGTLAFALWDGKKYAKIVDDEDRGDGAIATTGAFTTAVTGEGGDNFRPNETCVGNHFLRSDDPTATATFNYIGCAPGPHRLYHMLWDRMDYDRTPDAIYTVKDGAGSVLGVFHVDLLYNGSNAMWPRFDHLHAFGDWTLVGEFTLGAGQDTVVVAATNGTGSGVLVVDGMLLRNVPVPPAVPGDTVTLDMDAGVVTTNSGAQPAVVARPVTFATDVELMPVPAGPRTLKAGYNKEADTAAGPPLLTADRGPFTGGWRPVTGFDSVTLDDRGEMTAMAGSVYRKINAASYNYVDGRMLLRVPDGQKFRLAFDYAGDFNAEVKAGQTFQVMQNASYTKDASVNGDGYESLGGTRWRLWVTFHHSPWTPSSSGSPFLPWGQHDINFVVRHPITGFSMHDDRTPVDWPHFTHPTTYNRYHGSGLDCWRLMDMMQTNHSPVVDWTDYYPEDATGIDVLPYRYEQPVISVEPIDRSGADADGVLPWFGNAAFNCVVKVTVGSTAGLVNGHPLQFSNDQTIPADDAVLAGFPGALCFLTQPICVVLNSTQLLVSVFMNGASPGPSPSTCAAGVHTLSAGTTMFKTRPAQHPRIGARVCAELEITPWYDIPHLASDQYLRDWADMALAVHPAGTKVRVEYSNEVWNFPMHVEYVQLMARHANHLHDLDPIANPLTFSDGLAWGAWNSDRLRQIAAAEFAAVGRAADLYWILGTQTGNPGATTLPMVRWGAAQTPPVTLHFDALAMETYINFGTGLYNEPVTSDTDVNAFYDRLSVPDGQISMAACTVLDGGRAYVAGVHRDMLDANGFGDTEEVSYEGGWDWLGNRGTVDVNEVTSQELSRSHRIYPLTLAEWAENERAGFVLRCRYTEDYVGGVQGKEVWCDWPWTYCLPGTGDPAENPHPWDYDGTAFGVGRPVVSEMGGALLAWAAMSLGGPGAAATALHLGDVAAGSVPGVGRAAVALHLVDAAGAALLGVAAASAALHLGDAAGAVGVGARRVAAADLLRLRDDLEPTPAATPWNGAGGYLGTVMRGRRLPLLVRTVGPGSIPGVPRTPPVADLYAPDGTLAASYELPAMDRGGDTGLFGRAVRLGGDLPVGIYTVVYRYELGGFAGRVLESFALVAGDPAGAVISLHAHDRPEARYVLAQLDGGQLIQGRNPRF